MLASRPPATALAYKKLWLLIGGALVVLLLYGSLAPAKALPPLGGSDKLWHAGTYFVVMAYLSQKVLQAIIDVAQYRTYRR